MAYTSQNFADWSLWSAPFAELQQMNQEASEKVVRECISYYSDNAAAAVKCMQTMPRLTSPEDYTNTMMKILSQQGEKGLEFMQNVFQIYQDAIKDHAQWTEQKVSSAIKTASRGAKKFTEEQD